MTDTNRDGITAALVRAADAVEQLAMLREELAAVGRIAAGRLYRRGGSYAEAVWDWMPEGAQIGGEVWAAIEAGFRGEWDRCRRRRGA